MSRALFPKQFQALFGGRSLLQNTLLRAAAVSAEPPILICNEAHRFAAVEQCEALALSCRCIVLEAEGRNTAPAIALAAHIALAGHPQAQLLVLPSDHLIDDEDGFTAALQAAAAAAAEGALVAFGVRPHCAETGYGYIEPEIRDGASPPPSARLQAWPLRSFLEKPDLATAQALARSGRHLWNSGMFLFRAQTCLAEIEARSPRMARAVEAAHREGRWETASRRFGKPGFFRPGAAFLDSPAGAFDKVVMEHTDRAAVVPVDIGWADVGSWRAVERAMPADAQGNRISGDVVALDAHDNLIQAQSRLIGALGTDNLAIIETADAVLVAKRDRVQELGVLVERLKSSGRKEYERHREVFRPWGSWEDLHAGPGFKIRRVKLKPGAGISLQKHRHRAEHWVVVQGVAEVTRDGETFTLEENGGAQVSQGSAHRLRNAGQTPLELIEVQVGEQLDEDDVERLLDDGG